jgi:UDP-N-acetylmuramoyl-L-alanyl-D-glutamate--2,6-diaminopimelate ligase
MNLNKLAKAIKLTTTKGSLDIDIKQIVFDSREVMPGSLFVAIKGLRTDGHNYIDKAIAQGAVAVVLEELPEELDTSISYLQTEDSAKALGLLANQYYGEPSKSLKLIGITGTNGKTTTTTLLYQLFTELGYKVGLLSTVNIRIGNTELSTTHTTPDALTNHRILREMVDTGCEYVFMEVSSHAVVLQRIAGLHFTGGVFTNISHDHLDFHKTFKAYIAAKKMFFDNLPKTAFALVNKDDRRGEVMLQNTLARKHTFSVRSMATFKARVIDNSITGLQLELNGREVFSHLIGHFNAYNLLTIYAVAMLLEQDELETLTALSQLRSVEGRFEYIHDPYHHRTGIVDYAHTPDALENVLSTIRQVKNDGSQIITVVGCGGDRDKTKRPLMTKIACDYSDKAILTADNPRTESAEAILQDMQKGIPAYAQHKVLTIKDRKEAIRTSVLLAQAGDIILVAGKGHEKYQEINGVRYPFDDKAILKEVFNLFSAKTN